MPKPSLKTLIVYKASVHTVTPDWHNLPNSRALLNIEMVIYPSILAVLVCQAKQNQISYDLGFKKSTAIWVS